MKVVRITWDPDEARFSARGGHPDHTIAINAPHEGPSTGFSASELVLAGAGACSAWDVVEILRKARQEIDGVEVVVEGEQDTEPPWPYVWIRLVYRVTGRQVDRASVERAVRLSTEKYCSALASLSGVASIETQIELSDTSTGEEGQPIATGVGPTSAS